MFADDTSIFCFDSNLNQLHATMNNQLKIYCKWFNANKLSINANKTNYISQISTECLQRQFNLK